MPEPIPELEIPKYSFSDKPADWDEPLPIIVIKGWDTWAIMFNVISLTALFMMFVLLLNSFVTTNIMIDFKIALILVVVIVVVFYHRFLDYNKSQTADVYLDPIFKGAQRVYLQGLNIISWTAEKQYKHEEIDFKVHEIAMTCEEGNEIRFDTCDGYEVIAEGKFFISRMYDEAHLGRSLKYSQKVIINRVRASILSVVSDIGGKNAYDALLTQKQKLNDAVADIYCGNKLSPFEDATGWGIQRPIIESLRLSPESEKIYRVKAETKMIRQAVGELTSVGISADEAAIMTQVNEGNATRHVTTIQGLPQGAQFVALGDASMGVAIPSKQKKGR